MLIYSHLYVNKVIEDCLKQAANNFGPQGHICDNVIQAKWVFFVGLVPYENLLNVQWRQNKYLIVIFA